MRWFIVKLQIRIYVLFGLLYQCFNYIFKFMSLLVNYFYCLALKDEGICR